VGLATFNRDAPFDDFSIDEAQYEVSRSGTPFGVFYCYLNQR
jgi:hypothetical protein